MPQVPDGRLLELTLAPIRRLACDGGLQVRIEHLVRVQLRAVTGQVEHFDVLFVLLQPRLDQSGVMNLQVVQYQEHLGAVFFLGLGLFFIIIGVLFGVAGGILAFALHPSATYLIGYWIGVAGFLFCALGVVLNFVINSTEIFKK